MRNTITEEQITELMRAIPRAEEVDRQRAEIERLRENVDRAGKEVERADRLRAEIARVKSDDRKNRAENERLRAALTDMLSGWRYIRDTYGDLAGVGWDRVEQKARNALEGKP